MAALQPSGPRLLTPRHAGLPSGAAAMRAAVLSASADVAVRVEKERPGPWHHENQSTFAGVGGDCKKWLTAFKMDP